MDSPDESVIDGVSLVPSDEASSLQLQHQRKSKKRKIRRRCLREIQNVLNIEYTATAEQVLQIYFQRHIDKMRYREMANVMDINNHTDDKELTAIQASWEREIHDRLESLSECLKQSLTSERKKPNRTIEEILMEYSEIDGNSVGHLVCCDAVLRLISKTESKPQRVPIHELIMRFRSSANISLTEELKEDDVLLSDDVRVMRHFLKHYGCSHMNRYRIWRFVLDLECSSENRQRFLCLDKLVHKYDCLIDKFVYKDIRSRSGNHDQYFVFEELVFQVLLAFQREAMVELLPDIDAANCRQLPSVILTSPSLIVSPICFITDRVWDIYFIFKALCVRYFRFLTTLTFHQQGIYSLLCVFDDLLSVLEPSMLHHLEDCLLDIRRPIAELMLSGFSGPLRAEELLQLWDILIGHDTTLVFPIFAIGLLRHVKNDVFTATDQEGLEIVFQNVPSIDVFETFRDVIDSLRTHLDIEHGLPAS